MRRQWNCWIYSRSHSAHVIKMCLINLYKDPINTLISTAVTMVTLSLQQSDIGCICFAFKISLVCVCLQKRHIQYPQTRVSAAPFRCSVASFFLNVCFLCPNVNSLCMSAKLTKIDVIPLKPAAQAFVQSCCLSSTVLNIQREKNNGKPTNICDN